MGYPTRSKLRNIALPSLIIQGTSFLFVLLYTTCIRPTRTVFTTRTFVWNLRCKFMFTIYHNSPMAWLLHYNCGMDDNNYQKRTGKKLCAQCKKRTTSFSPKGGSYRKDSKHDLCGQCWRSIVDQTRSQPISTTLDSKKKFHSGCNGVILTRIK